MRKTSPPVSQKIPSRLVAARDGLTYLLARWFVVGVDCGVVDVRGRRDPLGAQSAEDVWLGARSSLLLVAWGLSHAPTIGAPATVHRGGATKVGPHVPPDTVVGLHDLLAAARLGS